MVDLEKLTTVNSQRERFASESSIEIAIVSPNTAIETDSKPEEDSARPEV